MSSVRWLAYDRTDEDITKHLCNIRGFDVDNLLPNYKEGLLDPFLFTDMPKAVELVREAKDNKWHVVIFGDYDADGTPASVILSDTLDYLGIDNEVMLPSRTDGYGLKGDFVKDIAKKAKLLITVDTGITAVEEVKELKKAGVKVIILDHHLPGNEIPKADAVIDSLIKDSGYPFTGLCGCAVAFKFIQALGREFKEIDDKFTKWLLDLVATSTVADMVPLVGENRVLVHYGLVVINHKKRPGIKAMLEAAGMDTAIINSTTLGFAIGPRLNASGRLNDNWPAYNLLKVKTLAEARKIAYEVEEANRQRQAMVEKVLEEAEKMLFEQNDRTDHLFTIINDGWPTGVVGLVAGKISQKFSRPTIVVSQVDNLVKGSARSIEAFNITEAISAYSKLLINFGGHKQAAGLSLDAKNWPEFSESIKKKALDSITKKDIEPTKMADAIIEGKEIKLDMAKKINSLQPFGMGNNKPKLIIKNVIIDDFKIIGQDKKHISFNFIKDEKQFRGIGFDLVKDFDHKKNDEVHLLGYLETNEWNGSETVQFRVIETQPASANIETIKYAKV